MEDYGFVEKDRVDYVDHTLAKDGLFTTSILKEQKKTDCKFYVGMSRWGRKEWCNSLYPTKTLEKDFLMHYAKHFNSIELNSTFYSIPSPYFIKSWKDKVHFGGNEKMLFIPKVSREISHINKLKDTTKLLEQYLNAVSEFGENLGPTFIQVGEYIGPKYFNTIKDFISTLPKEQEFFFDIRHKEWFNNADNRQSIFSLFADNNIGSIITDTSGDRDIVHMELTKPELFVRFTGNGEGNWRSDYQRIDAWVDRIGQWKDKGLRKVYFFVRQHREDFSPHLASYLINKLNLRFDANLTPLNLELFPPE